MVVVAFVGAVAVITSRALPQVSGTLAVPGLEASVTVAREQTLGTSGIRPLEWYLNAGPFPAPGAAGSLNATSYRFRRAYEDPSDPTVRPVGFGDVFGVTNLPSYRGLFDLGAVDGGRVIQTTGNAGNPFDRHYGDLIDDWLAGRTLPLSMTRGAIAQHTLTTLTLEPGGG